MSVRSLHWDKTILPHNVSPEDTHIEGDFIVKRGKGIAHLVRAVESISTRSGPMSWRIRLTGQHHFMLGVVGANHRSCDYANASVWMMYGDGNCGWGAGKWGNPNNESTVASYVFHGGDTVEMSYEPQKRLLTATVEGKPGWRVTRRLDGAGSYEVHPCVWLYSPNSDVEALSRHGMSLQEYCDSRAAPSSQQIKTILERQDLMMNMMEMMMQSLDQLRGELSEVRGELAEVRKGQAPPPEASIIADSNTEVDGDEAFTLVD